MSVVQLQGSLTAQQGYFSSCCQLLRDGVSAICHAVRGFFQYICPCLFTNSGLARTGSFRSDVLANVANHPPKDPWVYCKGGHWKVLLNLPNDRTSASYREYPMLDPMLVRWARSASPTTVLNYPDSGEAISDSWKLNPISFKANQASLFIRNQCKEKPIAGVLTEIERGGLEYGFFYDGDKASPKIYLLDLGPDSPDSPCVHKLNAMFLHAYLLEEGSLQDWVFTPIVRLEVV